MDGPFEMASPFVSSLRRSLGGPDNNATVSTDKSAMLSMFSGLDLTLDSSGSVVVTTSTGSRSAAKDLLLSKSTEKRAEAESAALQALQKQQQQQQKKQQQEQPVTALSQALSLFDKEMNDRDSFLSRNTKRRHKSGKKPRGDSAAAPASRRGRRQRQQKYHRL